MVTFQAPRPGQQMLSVEEAQARVLAEVRLLGTEQVVFTSALGRILREDVFATSDVPQADNTAMDGYAVRADDLIGASAESPVVLRVIEDLPAGMVALHSVEPGTATRIMTGALMPNGADTVVHVEITDAGGRDGGHALGGEVRVFRALRKGSNVRRRAEDMRKGEVVLRDGTPIRAAEVGVLAGVRKNIVRVGRKPSVAILSTGDELVDVDEQPILGKVVNSNSYSLASLVREAGALPRMVGIVRDSREETIAAIESAIESDVILSTGGVSVGAYDFVKDALDALGAETKFSQVAMKPGKPVVLSTLRDRLYFGLPGNPVSCMVSFLLFVAPALRKAMGQATGLLPPIIHVRLASRLTSRGERRTYQRVRVVAREGELVALPMPAQGSGVSTSMVRANALAIVEMGVTSLAAGELVPAVLYGFIENDSMA